MASAIARYNKNGEISRYEIRYTYQGVYHSTTWKPEPTWSAAKREKELEKAKAKFENDVQNGLHITKSEQKAQREAEERKAEAEPTLQQYTEQVFLPLKSSTCKRGCISAYTKNAELYIFPKLGAHKLKDITPAMLNSYFANYEKSTGTMTLSRKVLSGIFRMAYRTDVIDRNPMDKIEQIKAKPEDVESAEEDGFKAISEEDLAEIIKALQNEPLRWRAYFMFAIDTGCRNGEIFGIQKDCIDKDKCTVTIKRIIGYDAITKKHYVDTPKGRKVRTVPVSKATMDLLQELLEEQAEYSVISPWLFWNRKDINDLPSPTSANHWLYYFCKRNGFTHVWPHKLRHTNATLLITNNFDPATVAANLGHSTPSITLNMYTHPDENAKRKIAEFMSEITSKRA